MVEIRRGVPGEAAARERLPWLEPVEDEDEYAYAEATGFGGLILAAILVLVAIALITGAVIWYRGHRSAAGGTGQIIKAEPGPYKVRPDNPGGMKADANGEVTYGTSAGQDIDSPIDLNALPEQPMVQPKAAAKPQQPAPAQAPSAAAQGQPAPAAPKETPVASAPPPAPKPAPQPKPAAAPQPVASAPAATPAAATGGGGGTVQLGAFSSEAGAKSAWKSLSGRFTDLKELGYVVTKVETGDKTLYRLRATGAANAGRLCARLKVAGESCSVVE